jgi:FHS family L-fucose permease-like MFS transporter
MHSSAAAHSEPPAPDDSFNLSLNRRALAVLATLFFLSGFLAALNDILIPHLKPIFELNYAQIMLIQFSFFSAFLLFAAPSAMLISRMGYQWTMVIGLLTMSAGAFLFVPAANVPSFAFFMCALVILAGGITALQVSGNPYVAVLGPPRTASSRLTLTQACNSLGSTIAPTFGGLLLLDSSSVAPLSAEALHAYRLDQAAHVKGPYAGIAIALFVLALLVARSRLPPLSQAARPASGASGQCLEIPPRWSWRGRHLPRSGW